jgi:hypothetical protein
MTPVLEAALRLCQVTGAEGAIMIWALLALLGVPIWLLVGGLGATLLNRRAVKATPDVFRCKVRVTSGSVPHLGAKWPRTSYYAFWVRDVLIVRTGVTLMRTEPLAVTCALDDLDDRPRDGLRRLGPKATVLPLRLADDSSIEVAALASAEVLLIGPYLLAERGAAMAAASVPPEDGGREPRSHL